MNVLAFDPGGTTGICLQDENKVKFVTDTQNIHEWLVKEGDPNVANVDHVVIEAYIIRAHQQAANTGRNLKTVEVIGAIKSWCYRHNIKFTEYDPKIKPTQCKLTQVFPKQMPKNIEHRYDAFNHGRYYLIQQGLALTSLEAKMKAAGEI